MDWKTLRNTGYLATESKLPRGRKFKTAANFLAQVVEEFAQVSSQYFRLSGELPFTYGERQINSALLPAIAKVAEAALAEMPVPRKIKRRTGYGWADYWAFYESVDFLIEVKHGWHAVTRHRLRKATVEAWHSLSQQLSSLPSEIKAYTLTDQPLKMALLVVPCYQGSKYAENLQSLDRDDTVELFDFIQNELDKPIPNWRGLWHLHQELQEPFSLDDDGHELYPCVAFMAYIEATE